MMNMFSVCRHGFQLTQSPTHRESSSEGVDEAPIFLIPNSSADVSPTSEPKFRQKYNSRGTPTSLTASSSASQSSDFGSFHSAWYERGIQAASYRSKRQSAHSCISTTATTVDFSPHSHQCNHYSPSSAQYTRRRFKIAGEEFDGTTPSNVSDASPSSEFVTCPPCKSQISLDIQNENLASSSSQYDSYSSSPFIPLTSTTSEVNIGYNYQHPSEADSSLLSKTPATWRKLAYMDLTYLPCSPSRMWYRSSHSGRDLFNTNYHHRRSSSFSDIICRKSERCFISSTCDCCSFATPTPELSLGLLPLSRFWSDPVKGGPPAITIQPYGDGVTPSQLIPPENDWDRQQLPPSDQCGHSSTSSGRSVDRILSPPLIFPNESLSKCLFLPPVGALSHLQLTNTPLQLPSSPPPEIQPMHSEANFPMLELSPRKMKCPITIHENSATHILGAGNLSPEEPSNLGIPRSTFQEHVSSPFLNLRSPLFEHSSTSLSIPALLHINGIPNRRGKPNSISTTSPGPSSESIFSQKHSGYESAAVSRIMSCSRADDIYRVSAKTNSSSPKTTASPSTFSRCWGSNSLETSNSLPPSFEAVASYCTKGHIANGREIEEGPCPNSTLWEQGFIHSHRHNITDEYQTLTAEGMNRELIEPPLGISPPHDETERKAARETMLFEKESEKTKTTSGNPQPLSDFSNHRSGGSSTPSSNRLWVEEVLDNNIRDNRSTSTAKENFSILNLNSYESVNNNIMRCPVESDELTVISRDETCPTSTVRWQSGTLTEFEIDNEVKQTENDCVDLGASSSSNDTLKINDLMSHCGKDCFSAGGNLLLPGIVSLSAGRRTPKTQAFKMEGNMFSPQLEHSLNRQHIIHPLYLEKPIHHHENVPSKISFFCRRGVSSSRATVAHSAHPSSSRNSRESSILTNCIPEKQGLQSKTARRRCSVPVLSCSSKKSSLRFPLFQAESSRIREQLTPTMIHTCSSQPSATNGVAVKTWRTDPINNNKIGCQYSNSGEVATPNPISSSFLHKSQKRSTQVSSMSRPRSNIFSTFRNSFSNKLVDLSPAIGYYSSNGLKDDASINSPVSASMSRKKKTIQTRCTLQGTDDDVTSSPVESLSSNSSRLMTLSLSLGNQLCPGRFSCVSQDNVCSDSMIKEQSDLQLNPSVVCRCPLIHKSPSHYLAPEQRNGCDELANIHSPQGRCRSNGWKECDRPLHANPIRSYGSCSRSDEGSFSSSATCSQLEDTTCRLARYPFSVLSCSTCGRQTVASSDRLLELAPAGEPDASLELTLFPFREELPSAKSFVEGQHPPQPFGFETMSGSCSSRVSDFRTPHPHADSFVSTSFPQPQGNFLTPYPQVADLDTVFQPKGVEKSGIAAAATGEYPDLEKCSVDDRSQKRTSPICRYCRPTPGMHWRRTEPFVRRRNTATNESQRTLSPWVISHFSSSLMKVSGMQNIDCDFCSLQSDSTFARKPSELVYSPRESGLLSFNRLGSCVSDVIDEFYTRQVSMHSEPSGKFQSVLSLNQQDYTFPMRRFDFRSTQPPSSNVCLLFNSKEKPLNSRALSIQADDYSSIVDNLSSCAIRLQDYVDVVSKHSNSPEERIHKVTLGSQESNQEKWITATGPKMERKGSSVSNSESKDFRTPLPHLAEYLPPRSMNDVSINEEVSWFSQDKQRLLSVVSCPSSSSTELSLSHQFIDTTSMLAGQNKRRSHDQQFQQNFSIEGPSRIIDIFEATTRASVKHLANRVYPFHSPVRLPGDTTPPFPGTPSPLTPHYLPYFENAVHASQHESGISNDDKYDKEFHSNELRKGVSALETASGSTPLRSKRRVSISEQFRSHPSEAPKHEPPPLDAASPLKSSLMVPEKRRQSAKNEETECYKNSMLALHSNQEENSFDEIHQFPATQLQKQTTVHTSKTLDVVERTSQARSYFPIALDSGKSGRCEWYPRNHSSSNCAISQGRDSSHNLISVGKESASSPCSSYHLCSDAQTSTPSRFLRHHVEKEACEIADRQHYFNEALRFIFDTPLGETSFLHTYLASDWESASSSVDMSSVTSMEGEEELTEAFSSEEEEEEKAISTFFERFSPKVVGTLETTVKTNCHTIRERHPDRNGEDYGNHKFRNSTSTVDLFEVSKGTSEALLDSRSNNNPEGRLSPNVVLVSVKREPFSPNHGDIRSGPRSSSKSTCLRGSRPMRRSLLGKTRSISIVERKRSCLSSSETFHRITSALLSLFRKEDSVNDEKTLLKNSIMRHIQEVMPHSATLSPVIATFSFIDALFSKDARYFISACSKSHPGIPGYEFFQSCFPALCYEVRRRKLARRSLVRYHLLQESVLMPSLRSSYSRLEEVEVRENKVRNIASRFLNFNTHDKSGAPTVDNREKDVMVASCQPMIHVMPSIVQKQPALQSEDDREYDTDQFSTCSSEESVKDEIEDSSESYIDPDIGSKSDEDLEFPASPHADKMAEALNLQAKAHSFLHLFQGIHVYRVDYFNEFYTMGPELGSGGEGQVKICMPTQIVKSSGVHPLNVDWAECRYRRRLRRSTDYLMEDDMEFPGGNLDNFNPLDYAYAVKITPREAWKSELNIYSMAHFLGNLRHPNVLYHHAFYEDERNYFSVMNLADGPELLEYLLSEGDNASEELCRELLRQVLEALAYIHSRNLIHRDVKLENFICADIVNDDYNQTEDVYNNELSRTNRARFQGLPKKIPRILLIDFGISCYASDASQTAPSGTPTYMAPELFMESPVPPYKYNQKIDIWAAGVILCQMLTGRTPFDENGPAPLIEKVNKADLHETCGERKECSVSDNYMSISSEAYNGFEADDEFDLHFARLIAEKPQQEEQEQSYGENLTKSGQKTDLRCRREDEEGSFKRFSFVRGRSFDLDRNEEVRCHPSEEGSVSTVGFLANNPRQRQGCGLEGDSTRSHSFCSLKSDETPRTRSETVDPEDCSKLDPYIDAYCRETSSPTFFRSSCNKMNATPHGRPLQRQPTSLFGRGCLRLSFGKRDDEDNSEPSSFKKLETNLDNDEIDNVTGARALQYSRSMPLLEAGSNTDFTRQKNPLLVPSPLASNLSSINATVKASTKSGQLAKSNFREEENTSASYPLLQPGTTSKENSSATNVLRNETRSSVNVQRPRSKSMCWMRATQVEVPVEPARRGSSSQEFYRLRFDMEGEEWAHVSPEAKDVVRLLLTLDPNKRPSAAEVLEHPWFTNVSTSSPNNPQNKSLESRENFPPVGTHSEALPFELSSHASRTQSGEERLVTTSFSNDSNACPSTSVPPFPLTRLRLQGAESSSSSPLVTKHSTLENQQVQLIQHFDLQNFRHEEKTSVINCVGSCDSSQTVTLPLFLSDVADRRDFYLEKKGSTYPESPSIWLSHSSPRDHATSTTVCSSKQQQNASSLLPVPQERFAPYRILLNRPPNKPLRSTQLGRETIIVNENLLTSVLEGPTTASPNPDSSHGMVMPAVDTGCDSQGQFGFSNDVLRRLPKAHESGSGLNQISIHNQALEKLSLNVTSLIHGNEDHSSHGVDIHPSISTVNELIQQNSRSCVYKSKTKKCSNLTLDEMNHKRVRTTTNPLGTNLVEQFCTRHDGIWNDIAPTTTSPCCKLSPKMSSSDCITFPLKCHTTRDHVKKQKAGSTFSWSGCTAAGHECDDTKFQNLIVSPKPSQKDIDSQERRSNKSCFPINLKQYRYVGKQIDAIDTTFLPETKSSKASVQAEHLIPDNVQRRWRAFHGSDTRSFDQRPRHGNYRSLSNQRLIRRVDSGSAILEGFPVSLESKSSAAQFHHIYLSGQIGNHPQAQLVDLGQCTCEHESSVCNTCKLRTVHRRRILAQGEKAGSFQRNDNLSYGASLSNRESSTG